MEPVHSLGGHPIYEAMSEEDAFKITQKWKADGGKHGTKPRFRFKLDNPTKDTGLYRFQEIEKDATRKSGFRFKPVDTLASTAQTYREKIKKATISKKELFKIYQEEFPDAPKKEINQLVDFFKSEDKSVSKNLQLKRVEWERLYGKKWAIDHVVPVASDEPYTAAYTQKKVIENQINAFKSDKRGTAAFKRFLKDRGLDTGKNRILKSLYSEIEYDKPGSMAWNKAMAKYFKPKSKTATNIRNASLGGTALSVLDLLTPGDASAEQFRSAIHEGGSWSEAFQTFGSEKTGEIGTTLTTAPAFMAASRVPFAAGAFKAAAPAFALYSAIYAIDKADDIFLDGATKKFLKEHDPGEKIAKGAELTSMKGDFDFKGNKSIKYNSNVIQDKETGEWHSYQIPQI